jgi:hypothetical protein
MIDGLLGYYDRKYTVEAYQVEYNLLNSTDVKFLTAASLAELSTLLDKLAAGSYELDVKVVQDNGRISNHLVSLNKTQDDVVVVNATLQIVWQAPSVREDGSALVGSDIAGYEIYYTSIAPDNTTVDQFIEVGSADKTSYIMEQVPAGEYHFAIATVDTTGVKSSISDVVTTVVN